MRDVGKESVSGEAVLQDFVVGRRLFETKTEWMGWDSSMEGVGRGVWK
jgi:hypothetical protein